MIDMVPGPFTVKTVNRVVPKRQAWKDPVTGKWSGRTIYTEAQVESEIWVGDKWVPWDEFKARETFYTRRYFRRLDPRLKRGK